MIKISKKISVLIILIVMCVGVFAVGGLFKAMDSLSGQYDVTADNESMEDWYLEDMTNQILSLEDSRNQAQIQLDALPDEPEYQVERASLLEQISSTQDQIDNLNLAVDEKIFMFNGSTYLTMTLDEILRIKSEIRTYEGIPEEMRDADIEAVIDSRTQDLSDYMGVIESRSFEDYITISNRILDENTFLLESEKEIQRENNQLWLKLDPSGGMEDPSMSYQINNLLQLVQMYKRSIQDKLDYTSANFAKPMSLSEIEDMQNKLAVLEYKINSGNISSELTTVVQSQANDSIFSFGTFMISMMALILAGGSVSQEISSGSIKSLIIAPVKRWKIYTAKVASLVSVSFLMLVVLYIFGSLSYGLFFGFAGQVPYVFASNGIASSIPYAGYQFAILLVKYLDILVYMAFAFMLSVLTRNTAAAVGVSMAGYFGSGIAQQLLMIVPNYEWLRFLPFSNMDLQSRFFPFGNLMETLFYGQMSMGGSFRYPSLTFSLAYLVVIVFCMSYVAMDSFNRRDIK
jgi:ABC-type transport system involved in multi-copper enzyme maturation permease subunit